MQQIITQQISPQLVFEKSLKSYISEERRFQKMETNLQLFRPNI
uniref:Uncharacterized protein n=1 Tax=Anguilla anguilla TaxID=7936 RepID=A0A0E9XQ19_ANGAN